MDTTAPQPIPQQPLKKQAAPLTLVAFVLLGSLLFISGYTLGLENKNLIPKKTQQKVTSNKGNTSEINTQTSVKNAAWEKPTSSKQGFAFAKIDTQKNASTLSVYSLEDKKLRQVESIATSGSGAVGFGTSSPHTSPDFLYTAYIDKKNNVWLLSNETLEKKQVTHNGHVAYITAWSPDSKTFIYQIGDQTIRSWAEGYAYPESKVTFDKNLVTGFFLFNIETGEHTKLSPITNVETFTDTSHILTRPTTESDRLVVFNVNTFEADYGFIKDTFGFGASQYTFTRDGKKWTYTLSRHPATDANIIYADFPNKEGTIIETGAWADVQFPFLSPNGSHIAYLKREGYKEPGVPNEVIWIYDTKEQVKQGYIPGFIEAWINEEKLVFSRWTTSSQERTYYILNIKDRSVEEMK